MSGVVKGDSRTPATAITTTSQQTQNEKLPLSSLPPLPKSPPRKMSKSGLTSKDFADQIRQLELVGNQLRNSTLHIETEEGRGDNDCSDSRKNEAEQKFHQRNTSVDAEHVVETNRPLRTRAASLSSLPSSVDVQAPVIPDFRGELSLSRRNEFVQGDNGVISSNGISASSFHLPSRYSLPATFSVGQSLPSSNVATSNLSQNDNPDYLNKWMLEKKLTDSETEINLLKTRITELKDQADHSKRHYLSLIDELKTKLQDAAASRQSIMDLREKEVNGQETLISKLQVNVTQLQETNRDLEDRLSKATSNLDGYQQSQYVMDAAVKQLKMLLATMEAKRGKAYFDMEPLQNQNPTMLVHTLERCLQDYEVENDYGKNKIKHLENELRSLTDDFHEFRKTTAKENQEKLTHIAEEHEKQISATAERSLNARKQALSLQEQLDVLQTQSRNQLKMKDDHIRDLETKLNQIKKDFGTDKEHWQHKKCGLESTLDDTQKELLATKTDRDDLKVELRTLHEKTKQYEDMLGRLQNELDVEKDHLKKVQNREEQLLDKKRQLEDAFEEKELTVIQLQSAIEALRNESLLNLKEQMATMEKTERGRALDQMSVLQDELMSMTEKKNAANVELEILRTEITGLRSRISESEEKSEDVNAQFTATVAEKDHLSALLQDRVGDCQRLTSERDYYYSMLDEKNAEIAVLTSELKDIRADVHEKKHDLETLLKKSQEVTSALEIKSRHEHVMKDEHEKLGDMINEKIAEIEELKVGRDSVLRKLKIREKRLKELEADSAKMKDDITMKVKEAEEIKADKEGLFLELKESRYEVAFLKDELDALKKVLDGTEGDMQKQVKKLVTKLEATEKDLQLAKKALKRKEGFGGKAMKAAGKMQKEVTAKRGQLDSLHSKIYWLEECIESLKKEKTVHEEENEKLASLVTTTGAQNEKLTKELEMYITKYKDIREDTSKTASSYEKATLKNAAAQSQIEALEQDIARLKLKHQLELKEVLRTGSLNRELPPMISSQCPQLFNAHTSIVPPSTSDSKVMDNVVPVDGAGQELKSLLHEMRALISQSTNLAQTNNNNIDTQERPPSRSPKTVQFETDCQRHSAPQKLDLYLEMNSVQSPVKDETTGRLSPVSDLLSPREPLTSTAFNGSSKPQPTLLSSTYNHRSSGSNIGRKSTASSMASESQQLCQRLEQKIQNLSLVGAHLKHENREMAQLMKDQDKKLRKVREAERAVLKSKS
ncbi:coiled-coil domain-containing protein 158-like isoform X2 [Tubulanus polymorphus]|uniref:coiled-coil domain-containing protein 158-like isoform X2 n=1 Tax=Tubulanus polymorphus TaxID=672921 RepID=UPI003DA4704E